VLATLRAEAPLVPTIVYGASAVRGQSTGVLARGPAALACALEPSGQLLPDVSRGTRGRPITLLRF